MDTITYREYFESPAGWVEVTANGDSIVSVLFKGRVKAENLHPGPLTNLCTGQLKAYFKGDLKSFSLPLHPEGSLFQLEVWKAVSLIEYGKVTTYNDLSRKLGKPRAVRAVGAANGKNKLLMVIPCHRVIGADGNLVGYAGELWRKKWLLDMEAKVSGKGQMVLDF